MKSKYKISVTITIVAAAVFAFCYVQSEIEKSDAVLAQSRAVTQHYPTASTMRYRNPPVSHEAPKAWK